MSNQTKPTNNAQMHTNSQNLNPQLNKKSSPSLQDALDQAEDVLNLLNAQNVQHVATNVDTVRQEISLKTFDRAGSLSQALQHYQTLVKQEEQLTQRAEAEGKTAFDVKCSKEILFNGKKTLSEYKHYKESEMREMNVIQHQIYRINAELQGDEDDEEKPSISSTATTQLSSNIHNNNSNDDDNNGTNGDEFFEQQNELVSDIQLLEEEYSTLSAKLNIFQLFSHIQFIPSDDSNVIKGFATLQNIGDVRPFEIDLRLTPKEDIRDMIWGWLYDEHC